MARVIPLTDDELGLVILPFVASWNVCGTYHEQRPVLLPERTLWQIS